MVQIGELTPQEFEITENQGETKNQYFKCLKRTSVPAKMQYKELYLPSSEMIKNRQNIWRYGFQDTIYQAMNMKIPERQKINEVSLAI